MDDAVIVAAARTPVGRFQGALASVSAVTLGALCVREVVMRAGLNTSEVNECILGHVLTAGLGQNTARQAALGAGLPDTVSAMVVNKVCGSGLKAVALAAQAIQTGNAEVVIAGGMESMSNSPFLLPHARSGLRMGDAVLVDSMIRDGLWDVYNDYHMGMTAENIADAYGISRMEQDLYALESHRRAAQAQQDGTFLGELVGVPLPATRNVPSTVMMSDESVRADSTLEALGRLKPAFKDQGTVTAGNAPGLNDGAAVVAVMSADRAQRHGRTVMARIVAQATSGTAPSMMGLAPVLGIRRVLERAGWTMDQVDLFELNEAFSVQALAVIRELGLPPDRVNVNGGAVALGHPIGASGARILVTLLYAMKARGLRRGVAALCLGGGNSVALAIEVEQL